VTAGTLIPALLLVLSAVTLLRALVLRRLSARLGPVPGPDDVPDEILPSLSIVVAARNEERHLEEAVRSWLALDLPRLQVVVVDDRSTDGTSGILERLARERRELVHLRVDRRPDDWLGKCWALQQGADRATGDWLLFTDADVVFDRRAIRRVLAHVQRESIDHLALLPRIHAEGLAQRAFTWLFFQLFLTLLGGLGAHRDSGRGSIGVGAFGLVRRAAYVAAGGHEPIRLQVGDDVALARLFVRAGFRQRAHWGLDVAELEWQAGLWATVKGLEKNFFWGLRFSLGWLLLATAGCLAHLLPLTGPAWGGPLGWSAFGLWWLGIALSYVFPGAGARERAFAVLLHPFSVLLLVVTLWNSAVATWRHGGIVWRDDRIPLGQLRRALKPVSWWTERVPPRNPSASLP
jgi:glycosyltransferase involved in cell wall biosynthesis